MMRRLALLCLLAPSLARADGLQLERWEPPPAGAWTFGTHAPWYSSTRWVAAGLSLDYAHNALLGGNYDPNGTFHQTAAIVEHMLVGHVDVAGSFLDRVQLSATLPVTLMERGTEAFGLKPIGGAAVGDPRFGVFVRLWGQAEKSPVSIHLGGFIWAPIGADKYHAGDPTVRGIPEIALGGLIKRHVRWWWQGGILIRPQVSLGFGPGSTAVSQFQTAASLHWTDLDKRYSVGPELSWGVDLLGPNAGKRRANDVGLLVGASYNIVRQVQIGLAIGAGLLTQVGDPDVRVIARLAYAPIREEKKKPPKPADSDGDGVADDFDNCPHQSGSPGAKGCPDEDKDGIPDAQDACPNQPPGTHPDPNAKGCPVKDADNDGIPDAEDACPNLPPGATPDPKLKGCPVKDADNDGIPDAEDACPNLPPGAHPDPKRPGCAMADQDNDGVPDAEDACPDQAGQTNPSDPKQLGCPKIELTQGSVTELRSVHFRTNEAVLLPESFPILDAVAKYMLEHKEVDEVEIAGHADDTGTHEWNLRLSRHRAQACVDYLASKGVRKGRLRAVGYGDTKPLSTDRSDEQRARNRRVEVRVPGEKN
jgi:outer membrane protein OmpA-like peptidoglycan-associated protein